MKIVKILGSEKCYLMEDGSKVPFGEFKNLMIEARKKKILEQKEINRPIKIKKRRRKKK